MRCAPAGRRSRCATRFPSSASRAGSASNTGEVVTGTEERLATGDAVNVAARLQQAAAAGRGADRGGDARARRGARRGRGGRAARAEGEGAAGCRLPAARGARGARARPRRALRRPRARARADPRRRGSGRGRSGAASWSRSSATPASASRASSRRRSPRSRRAIVRGRCLPYGEGITYWPVVEVIKQLDALPSDEAAAAAIRSLLGETTWPRRPRRSPGRSASCSRSEAPLIVVFDDIQWGEETFLDSSSTSRCSPPGRRSCCSAWRGRSSSSAAPSGR